MLIIETWVTMVGDGPDCCRSGRTVVPFPYLKPFVLAPRLHNNLPRILQNPDRILKKVWQNSTIQKFCFPLASGRVRPRDTHAICEYSIHRNTSHMGPSCVIWGVLSEISARLNVYGHRKQRSHRIQKPPSVIKSTFPSLFCASEPGFVRFRKLAVQLLPY